MFNILNIDEPLKVAVDRWFIAGLVVFEALHPARVAVLWGGALVKHGLWEDRPDWLAESPAELRKLGVQKR